MWSIHGYIWGMHYIWWITWTFFFLMYAVLLVFTLTENDNTQNPIDKLKKKFLKGEISQEEFEQTKNRLEHAN